MTREEFIGKLRSIYVGEENAIDEIISEYNSMINLNNQLVEECQRLDDEETRLNNIINELEKWLNEYYKSNRKWYNTELSNHDKQYYEEVYRNTEFMIVKFKKQLKALKEDNK